MDPPCEHLGHDIGVWRLMGKTSWQTGHTGRIWNDGLMDIHERTVVSIVAEIVFSATPTLPAMRINQAADKMALITWKAT